MKKLSSIMLLAAGVFAFSACSSNDDIVEQSEPQAKGEVITLTASYGTDSRVALGADDKALSWEDGDKLKVWTAAKGDKNIASFLLSTGSGTTNGQFTGALNYTETPTSETKLYAVVAQDLDINGEQIISRLGSQKGTKEDAMGHIVLWGETTYGEKNFTFQHKLDMLKLTVNVDGVKNQPVTIKLRGEGVTSRVVFDPATGEGVATPGEITMENVELDGKGNATLYVATFPGNYRDLEATVTYTAGGESYYAPARVLNGTKTLEAGKTYTATVGFSKPVTAPVPGQFLYADGTWGDDATSSAVALIISNEVSSTDFRAGYTHGYAMALKDLSGGSIYEFDSTSENEKIFPALEIKNILVQFADFDGLTQTDKLYAAVKDHDPSQTGREIAAIAVKAFDADRATGSSEWFLPTMGQWYKVIQTFSPEELTTENDYVHSIGYDLEAPTYIQTSAFWPGHGAAVVDAINAKLQAAKDVAGNDAADLITKTSYWGCQEGLNNNGQTRGCAVSFNTAVNVVLLNERKDRIDDVCGIGLSNKNKTATPVRPFLAF